MRWSGPGAPSALASHKRLQRARPLNFHVRLVAPLSETAMADPHRWLLEHDNEGEVYTRPRTDKALIREVMELFNGSTIFYCCLFDNTDEGCLWCVGEPDRRLIEGRLFEDDTIFHFVTTRKVDAVGEPVALRHGMKPNEVVKVQSCEVLSAAEAVTVFLGFFRNKSFPEGYELVPKAYLFGSLSFKD
jgi:hypothetical protein